MKTINEIADLKKLQYSMAVYYCINNANIYCRRPCFPKGLFFKFIKTDSGSIFCKRYVDEDGDFKLINNNNIIDIENSINDDWEIYNIELEK